jgi:carbonic anhydrase/acetyltransferase-like protein (isoleucine patch superfamily)
MIYGRPKIHPEARIAAEAVIAGDVTVGRNSSVWYFSVVRGDEAPVTIGKGTNIQENCTIHVSHGLPAFIGDGVTVGHNAVLHSCSVGDGSLIGMGAVVLDSAVIGKECLIAAGSLVTKGTQVPDGSLVMGSPAKVKRLLTEEEKQDMRRNAETYLQLSEGLRHEE